MARFAEPAFPGTSAMPRSMPFPTGTGSLPPPPTSFRQPFEPQWKHERANLINYVDYQEQAIKDLRERVKSMPKDGSHVNPYLVARLDNIEAAVIASKIVPVATPEELIPPPNKPDPNRVPNGLLAEFWHRTTVDGVEGDEGDDDDDDEDDDANPFYAEWEERQQREMERISMMLGLPGLRQIGLPEGSKIIDIRQVEAPDMPEYRKLPLLPEHIYRPPPRPPPPVLHGRIHDSNFAYVPSPYHPVGPMAKMVVDGKPLLQNVYPIDRAPIKYQDVFANPVNGAPVFTPVEKSYKAYADFYESRRCPQRFPEVTEDMDADRGNTVRNVKWRTQPRREHVVAKAVDVTGDGFSDVIVVGKDRNYDGIPDAMQVPPLQRAASSVLSNFFAY